MYKSQNETFEFGGMKLICKPAPRHQWPCQRCALNRVCGDLYSDIDFPACSPAVREDKAQVVFYEVFDDYAPRRRQSRNR